MNANAPAAPSLIANARRILAAATPRRRAQLAATIALTFLGALAELLTVGAVVPLLAIAAQSSTGLTVPIVSGAIDSISDRFGVSPLEASALVLCAAALAAMAIRLTLVWMSGRFVYGLMHDVVMRFYGRAVRQPYLSYVRQNSSVMLAGLDKIWDLCFGVVSPLVLAFSSAFIALCLIGLLFWLDAGTALVACLSLGVIYGGLMLLTKGRLGPLSARIAVARNDRIRLLQESLGGLRDILLDQSQELFEREMRHADDQLRKDLTAANLLQLAPRPVVEGAAVVLIAVLALWVGSGPGGLIDALPKLGAIAIGAQRLLPPIQAVYFGWTAYSIYSHSITDVADLLDLPVEALPAGAASATLPFEHDIALDKVDFGYHGTAKALHGVDLTIRRGETIGIIGKTGSGKSTLVDLLMGLIPPTSGTLSVDGLAVTDDRQAAWRGNIAHVPQAIFLSDSTIAQNIAFGLADLDLARVRSAAAKAGLAEFIDTLPEGYATRVGERGVRLSGGQRQRIGIARAVYREARLLILDEATSALDLETEEAVMHSVMSLDPALTIILVTHRLTTIAHCDRVYRLADGRIAEHGPPGQFIGARKAKRGRAS